MKQAQKKYRKEVKSKIITFYKHEKDLLDFANSINFQGEVKQWLKRTKRYVEKYGWKGAKWVTLKRITALNNIT